MKRTGSVSSSSSSSTMLMFFALLLCVFRDFGVCYRHEGSTQKLRDTHKGRVWSVNEDGARLRMEETGAPIIEKLTPEEWIREFHDGPHWQHVEEHHLKPLSKQWDEEDRQKAQQQQQDVYNHSSSSSLTEFRAGTEAGANSTSKLLPYWVPDFVKKSKYLCTEFSFTFPIPGLFIPVKFALKLKGIRSQMTVSRCYSWDVSITTTLCIGWSWLFRICGSIKLGLEVAEETLKAHEDDLEFNPPAGFDQYKCHTESEWTLLKNGLLAAAKAWWKHVVKDQQGVELAEQAKAKADREAKAKNLQVYHSVMTSGNILPQTPDPRYNYLEKNQLQWYGKTTEWFGLGLSAYKTQISTLWADDKKDTNMKALYTSSDGRWVHRYLTASEQAGEPGSNDGALKFLLVNKRSAYPFNYDRTLTGDARLVNFKRFKYNLALSVGNFFIRMVADIQALFNLFWAGYPEWDGDCSTIPTTFDPKEVDELRKGYHWIDEAKPKNQNMQSRYKFLDQVVTGQTSKWKGLSTFVQPNGCKKTDCADLQHMYPLLWCTLAEEYFTEDSSAFVATKMRALDTALDEYLTFRNLFQVPPGVANERSGVDGTHLQKTPSFVIHTSPLVAQRQGPIGPRNVMKQISPIDNAEVDDVSSDFGNTESVKGGSSGSRQPYVILPKVNQSKKCQPGALLARRLSGFSICMADIPQSLLKLKGKDSTVFSNPMHPDGHDGDELEGEETQFISNPGALPTLHQVTTCNQCRGITLCGARNDFQASMVTVPKVPSTEYSVGTPLSDWGCENVDKQTSMVVEVKGTSGKSTYYVGHASRTTRLHVYKKELFEPAGTTKEAKSNFEEIDKVVQIGLQDGWNILDLVTCDRKTCPENGDKSVKCKLASCSTCDECEDVSGAEFDQEMLKTQAQIRMELKIAKQESGRVPGALDMFRDARTVVIETWALLSTAMDTLHKATEALKTSAAMSALSVAELAKVRKAWNQANAAVTTTLQAYRDAIVEATSRATNCLMWLPGLPVLPKGSKSWEQEVPTLKTYNLNAYNDLLDILSDRIEYAGHLLEIHLLGCEYIAAAYQAIQVQIRSRLLPSKFASTSIRSIQLQEIANNLATRGQSDGEANWVMLELDKACTMPTNVVDWGSPQPPSSRRPECERATLSQAFTAIFPTFVLRAIHTRAEMARYLDKLPALMKNNAFQGTVHKIDAKKQCGYDFSSKSNWDVDADDASTLFKAGRDLKGSALCDIWNPNMAVIRDGKHGLFVLEADSEDPVLVMLKLLKEFMQEGHTDIFAQTGLLMSDLDQALNKKEGVDSLWSVLPDAWVGAEEEKDYYSRHMDLAAMNRDLMKAARKRKASAGIKPPQILSKPGAKCACRPNWSKWDGWTLYRFHGCSSIGNHKWTAWDYNGETKKKANNPAYVCSAEPLRNTRESVCSEKELIVCDGEYQSVDPSSFPISMKIGSTMMPVQLPLYTMSAVVTLTVSVPEVLGKNEVDKFCGTVSNVFSVAVAFKMDSNSWTPWKADLSACASGAFGTENWAFSFAVCGYSVFQYTKSGFLQEGEAIGVEGKVKWNAGSNKVLKQFTDTWASKVDRCSGSTNTNCYNGDDKVAQDLAADTYFSNLPEVTSETIEKIIGGNGAITEGGKITGKAMLKFGSALANALKTQLGNSFAGDVANFVFQNAGGQQIVNKAAEVLDQFSIKSAFSISTPQVYLIADPSIKVTRWPEATNAGTTTTPAWSGDTDLSVMSAGALSSTWDVSAFGAGFKVAYGSTTTFEMNSFIKKTKALFSSDDKKKISNKTKAGKK